MADADIRLETIEDGGNPRKKKQIHQIDENSFSITPFSEDNDPNYKFRLEVNAVNNSGSSRKIFLQINWNEPLYNKYRTTIYHACKGNGKWDPVPMRNNGSYTSGELMLQSGGSTITLQPSYSYGDYAQFIKGILPSIKIYQECIGRTVQNRKIHQITLNDKAENKKKDQSSLFAAFTLMKRQVPIALKVLSKHSSMGTSIPRASLTATGSI